jgi:alpha-tubulin suppressor-like RCC1 family protein
MPRISALPAATTASLTDQFPLVQGAVTKRISFLTAQTAGIFQPSPNSISTLELADDSVTSDKLQADLSVDANRAVTSDHIRSGAVTEPKLNVLSVSTGKLQDLSVTNPKLADGALSISKFNATDQSSLLSGGSARVGGKVIVDGFVASIVIYNSGSGYATVPAVTLTGGGATAQATAVATLGGVSGDEVVSIALTSEGSGYKSDPVVTIDPPVSGTTAKAYAYAIPNGLATSGSLSSSFGSQHGGHIMTSDRKLKAWGYNGYGQLGIAADNGSANLPQEVFLYTDSNSPPIPVKFYNSGGSSWLIDSTGNVWSTGYNGYGQLGQGGTSNSFVFQQINPTNFQNKKVIKIAPCPASSTEAQSVLALTADGSVFAWGYNGYGQLGLGNTAQQNTPVLVPGTGSTYIISDIAIGPAVSSSTIISAMIVSNVNNQVLVAGYNGHGALANGTTGTLSPNLGYWSTASGTPLQNVTGLHINGDYPNLSCSTSLGELWTAGYNANGELGNGTFTSTNAGYATRVISSGVRSVTGNAAYYGYKIVLMLDGTIRVFGYNGYGALGNGTVTSNPNPTDTFSATAAGRTVVKIVCNQYHYEISALLLNDGSIFTAGYDGYSQQGRQDGGTPNRTTWGKYRLTRSDVVDLRWQSYAQYSVLQVLTADGKMYNAGYNGNGDLCRGDYTSRYGISNCLL